LSKHFLEFDQQTRSWIFSKTLQTYSLLQP
jgi:hypothetical protein